MNNDFVENVNITLKEYERLVAVEKKLSSMVKQAKENGTPPGYVVWEKTFGIYFGEKEKTNDIKEPEETNIYALTKELARLSSENRELRNEIKKLNQEKENFDVDIKDSKIESIAYLYGIKRKENETDGQFKKRISDFRKSQTNNKSEKPVVNNFNITINNNGCCNDKSTAEKVSKEIERILLKQYNKKEKRKILKEEYRNKALEPMIHQEWEMLANVFDVKRSKNEDYSDWTERIKFAMYG